MNWRALKYTTPLLVFGLAWIAFHETGWKAFLPIFWSYMFIPFVELIIPPSAYNLSAAEEEMEKNDRTYDYILYAILPLQYIFLFVFLFSLQQPNLDWVTIAGRVLSMGLLCGAFGINVAHELGHRKNVYEQWMAKFLLLTSQYMHFFTEHNKGHHKRVATREDPSSARLHESLFEFYPRTIIFSYISAWHIASEEMKKKNLPIFHWKNEMVQNLLIQLGFLVLIYWLFGTFIFLAYLAAAALGIGLLETVNYIEHYGLQRTKKEGGQYERAMPHHSWNSNHALGRIMLFELSRHSDHHYLASRKYQILRHHDDAPQMPTGYPGMMILAHIPPLFFYIMKKQMKKYAVLQPTNT